MEHHLAQIAFAEIGSGILRPLVRLGEQQTVGVFAVHVGAQFFDERIGLGEVLAVGPFPLIQVGDSVQPQPVDPHVEPEVQGPYDVLMHPRVVEVEVRLVGVKAVPVVRIGHRVPCPVGSFEVPEDDPRVPEFVLAVAPDVIIPPRGARFGAARPLKPGVLVRGMVQDQFGYNPNTTGMGLPQKIMEITEGPVLRVDSEIIRDVVAVVAERRDVEGEDPDGGDAQVAQVGDLLQQTPEIADAVAVAVEEAPDMDLVNDGVLVPERDIFSQSGHCPYSFTPWGSFPNPHPSSLNVSVLPI